MGERELLEEYKTQMSKAQYYLGKYISELKFHFNLQDMHIIKILEKEIKNLKMKNTTSVWFFFLKKP